MTNKKELISRITINKTICSILNFQLKLIKIITFVENYTESLNFFLSDESVSQISCHDTNQRLINRTNSQEYSVFSCKIIIYRKELTNRINVTDDASRV